MATKSVATQQQKAVSSNGNEYDLWLRGSTVLTVGVNRATRAFPPDRQNIAAINQTIQDLARAAKAVAFHAENADEAEGSVEFLMRPIEGIADSIIFMAQLSEAVREQLDTAPAGEV
jgi:hypothetical protein